MNNNINCIQAGTLNGGVFANMFESNRRVYSDHGVSPTVTTFLGGGRELKITEEKEVCGAVRTGGHGSTDRHSWDLVCEPMICASRGRNPENPSDRTVGAETQQRIEINENGTANTITTVQKDNMVAEPQLVGGIGDINFGTQWRQGNRVYDSDSVGMCLTASNVGNAGGESYLYAVESKKYCKEYKDTIGLRRIKGDKDYPVQGKVFSKPDADTSTAIIAKQRAGVVTINNKSYRIRKLTPKECWRLMDYSDEDFEKAKAMGTSAQSLYKQAGNGIVVACLEGIYDKLFVHTDLTEPKQLSLF